MTGPAIDLTGGLRVAFDGYRLVLTAPATMQIALTPGQWQHLAEFAIDLGDNLFPFEMEYIERVSLCPDCPARCGPR